MIFPAITTGVLLFLLGPIFFALGGAHKSPTAFIPSFIGIIILACGLAARTPSRTKAAMHIAVVVALLGILGSLRFVSKWPQILTGQRIEGELGAWSGFLMFLICGVFVAASVKWFIGNRRKRA